MRPGEFGFGIFKQIANQSTKICVDRITIKSDSLIGKTLKTFPNWLKPSIHMNNDPDESTGDPKRTKMEQIYIFMIIVMYNGHTCQPMLLTNANHKVIQYTVVNPYPHWQLFYDYITTVVYQLLNTALQRSKDSAIRIL